jgi:hypothetical protein
MMKCPLCDSNISRTSRSSLLRRMSVVIDIYKFKCASEKCEWEGLVVSQTSKKKLINNFLLGILLLGLGAGVVGIFYAVELNNEMLKANQLNNPLPESLKQP